MANSTPTSNSSAALPSRFCRYLLPKRSSVTHFALGSQTSQARRRRGRSHFPANGAPWLFHRRVESIAMGINNRKKRATLRRPLPNAIRNRLRNHPRISSVSPYPLKGASACVEQRMRPRRREGGQRRQLAHFEALLPQ
jgi:hypothetical protein